MQTMSPIEILSMIEGSMITNNLKNYSSAGSRIFDSGIRLNTGNGLENLTEVSEAIAEYEDETEKIQNSDDLKTHLSQCFFGKYALVSPVNKRTASVFKSIGISLPVHEDVENQYFDLVCEYIESVKTFGEKVSRSSQVHKLFWDKIVIQESLFNHDTTIQSVISGIQHQLTSGKVGVMNYYRSFMTDIILSSGNENIPNTISLLAENIKSNFGEVSIETDHGLISYTAHTNNGTYEFIFMNGANIEGTLFKGRLHFDCTEIYCLIPFVILHKEKRSFLVKKGLVQTENNINTFASEKMNLSNDQSVERVKQEEEKQYRIDNVPEEVRNADTIQD